MKAPFLFLVLIGTSAIAFAHSDSDSGGHRGLTRDHDSTIEACGVGNYLFRNDRTCEKPITTTSAAAISTGILTDPNATEREQTFYYDTNEAAIDSDEQADVMTTVDFLRTHPNARVEIRGYADGTGTLMYNEKLANRRAEEVQSKLVSANVSPGQISVVTPDQAVSSIPDSPFDRKVEVRILQLAE